MDIFNLFGDEWDREHTGPGFHARTTFVGKRVGGELLGASLYELDPGDTPWPLHLHHANEEWLVVLRGRPSVRTPDGERELAEGDVACFVRGERGAHQVVNRSDATARVLMLSTQRAPEIVEYLDSDKVGLRGPETGLRSMLRRGPQLDYWEGEGTAG